MADTPQRMIRLLRPPDESGAGLLALTAKRKTTFYVFREIPCDIGGRGFLTHRLGLGAVYHVRVGKPEDRSCECMGFLAHGHCKHIEGLEALVGHKLI
jgi:hypothetical protein